MRTSLACLWLASAAALAQSARAPESLSAWRYFKPLNPPSPGSAWAELILDAEVLGQARDDLADLRLYDAQGREIPHALRILRDLDDQKLREGRLFNQATEGASTVVSVDLGDTPQQHNLVDIDIPGTNFRRFATLEASPDGAHWSTLAAQVVLFRFAANGQTLEQHRIGYPESRQRYLRLHITRDPQSDTATPVISDVHVQRRVQAKGELAQFPLTFGGREPDRHSGRPASVWNFDAGAGLPISRLQLTVTSGRFSRPFELAAVDDPASPRILASGEVHDTTLAGPLLIDFPEQYARRLRLTVIDDRNEPLSLVGTTVFSAAREVLFELPAAGSAPLRLYYGNPDAIAPHYDLNARLDAGAAAPRPRLALGSQRANPDYSPRPKPFTERHPWLVYAILIAACVVLAGLLWEILRSARLTLGSPAEKSPLPPAVSD